MGNKKAVFGIMAFLACTAVILWSIDTYVRPGYQCGTESLERANRTKEVIRNHRVLLVRYPNRIKFKREFLRDEETGLRTDAWGVIVIVSEKVEQDTLPPESQIPDSLDGVPVQVITLDTYIMAETFQGGFPSEDDPHVNLAFEVREKNRDLFRRNPSFKGVGFITAGRGEPGNRIASIELYVSEKVNQRALPAEQKDTGLSGRCTHQIHSTPRLSNH